MYITIKKKIGKIMKTEKTKNIEKILLNLCFGTNPKLAKEYGTNEVTILWMKMKQPRICVVQ